MSEERMNPNFDLESCLRNKINEAKRYLEDKNKRQKDEPCEESSYAESFIYYFQNVETLLDLYQKTKYELEGKECVIDTMTHNEEVLTRNYEILEKKLQQEKEKNKTLEELLQGRLFELYNYYKDLAGSYQANCISKDKIKAKIKEIKAKKDFPEFADYEWNDTEKILFHQADILDELLERR